MPKRPPKWHQANPKPPPKCPDHAKTVGRRPKDCPACQQIIGASVGPPPPPAPADPRPELRKLLGSYKGGGPQRRAIARSIRDKIEAATPKRRGRPRTVQAPPADSRPTAPEEPKRRKLRRQQVPAYQPRPRNGTVNLRAPYTKEEWEAICAALKAERRRRNVDHLPARDQMEVVDTVLLSFRSKSA